MKIHLLALALCALPLLSARPVPDNLSPEAIQKLLDQGKFEQAVEALELVVSGEHADGMAWYHLAYARHATGNFSGAIEAGKRAAGFHDVRASSLYNLACSYSLSGDLDSAEKTLRASMSEGFMDFTLIETDTDLEPLRKAGRLPALPLEREYEVLRARNRLDVPYHVILPKGFDSEREYPFVLAFAPGGHQRRDADWMISQLFSEGMGDEELVTVVVMAPDPSKGWMTHPSHHALEDLLKKIKKDYKVRGKRFTFFGFLSGHSPAVTYSQMSRKYASGLVVAAASPCTSWSDREVRELAELPVTLITGTADEVNREATERLRSLLSDKAGFELRSIEGDGAVLASLRGKALVAMLADVVRAQAE